MKSLLLLGRYVWELLTTVKFGRSFGGDVIFETVRYFNPWFSGPFMRWGGGGGGCGNLQGVIWVRVRVRGRGGLWEFGGCHLEIV